jgi:hypothetical protein
MAPSRLKKFWEENPNWIKRYQQTSTELNMLLCGLPIEETETMWNSENVKEFKKYMNSHVTVLNKQTILYRGTTEESPTMRPLSFKMLNCQFMSTSKSKEIAEEFNWRKKGVLHTFICKKGVKIYDVNENLTDGNMAPREEEVIIYPNHKMILIKRETNNLTWSVEPIKSNNKTRKVKRATSA